MITKLRQKCSAWRALLRARCRRLWRLDRRGGMAVVLALSFVPILFMVGLAIDLARAYLAHARLGHALDAAGLAVGAASNITDDEKQALFQKFFAANYPPSAYGTPHSLALTLDPKFIAVSGSADVPTAFMRVAGIETITVRASAEIIRETRGLELVMALDNTGSMAGTKLTTLKAAATDLVNILFGDAVTPPETLAVGIVPFAGTVNIGPGNAAFTIPPTHASFSSTQWGTGGSWWGCVLERPAPYDTTDDNIIIGGKWEQFYWPDHSSYNNWKLWGGGYDIDNTPPSNRGPNKQCPRAITPLTNNKATLLSAINAMWASGNTHINVGAAWAWRAISPEGPFDEGHSYGDVDWNKAVVIMTDGDNTMSNSVFTAYKYLGDTVLGTTSQSTAEHRLDARLLSVCDGMKNLGIIVYTIAFEVNNIVTENLLRSCASDGGKYFSANGTDLRTVFRTIGGELSNLRLSK